MDKYIYIFSFIYLLILIILYFFYKGEITFFSNRSKNNKSRNETLLHPINIIFDFSNIKNNTINNNLINLLEEGKIIISNLIFCNNNRKISINEEIISQFKEEILFLKKEEVEADLIILPIFKKFKIKKRKNIFDVLIYKEFGNKRVQPSIAILNINNQTNFKKIFKNKNSKYILLMEILRALTDCLGLSLDFMEKKKQPKNNFFETPSYLISNSSSFKSIQKLYNLLDKPIPEQNISLNGKFYLSYWDKNSVIQDFRNEIIDLKSDLSEVSLNLLNDMDYYKVENCDFQYFNNNTCYRIDQKCLNINELQLFYLNYGINFEKENEIICYLSNSNNLKNNQCGITYGQLLHKNLDLCPIIKKSKSSIKSPSMGQDEIPELIYYKNQTLNLLKPSGKCQNIPRTIYFKYENRNVLENEMDKVETITFNETQRKFFVTYLTEGETYFNEYLKILKSNGLIRSYYHNNNHNLFLKSFYENDLNNKNKINQYQKIFNFIGNKIFFHKDSLYSNYLYMKYYFPELYDYMPETFIYPNDKKAINKKFEKYKLDLDDLWIVKPTNLFSGKGIHIFKSLKEEKNDKYLISKYLGNPHLIKGRKYDLRLYVLVTGLNPLRIYLNKEGLVRIATNEYSLEKNSLENNFIHLTNTAINKKSESYVYAKNINDENANKWNLHTYRVFLKEQNIDSDLLFKKIKDIIIKTIISGQSALNNIISKINISNKSMFNLFGFDILIDSNFNPILLEVNTRPFMFIYDAMDKVIKTNLFIDTLNIVGLIPFSHEPNYKSFDKENPNKDKVKDNVNYAICELTRPRGDFEFIFPLKSNIQNYKKLFFKNISNENKLFWDEIMKLE